MKKITQNQLDLYRRLCGQARNPGIPLARARSAGGGMRGGDGTPASAGRRASRLRADEAEFTNVDFDTVKGARGGDRRRRLALDA